MLAQIRDIPTEQVVVDSALLGRFYSAVAAIVPYMKYREQDAKQIILEKAKQYMIQNETCNIPDVAHHCLISEAALYNVLKGSFITSKLKSMIKNIGQGEA